MPEPETKPEIATVPERAPRDAAQPEPESKSVIERVREQLALGKKERGFKTAIYRDLPDGTKELKGYAKQHIVMQSADVLELCELAAGNDKADEIVRALEKGHKATGGKGTNYADDIFHLLEAAGGGKEHVTKAKKGH